MIPAFPKNSRVAFIGDSITAINVTLPYVIHTYKTKFKNSGIRFFNCGVAGGTAGFALESYEFDIARYKPTHAVVSFGINDSEREELRRERDSVRYEILKAAFERFKENITALVDRLISDGVKVILCTPVPYDEYSIATEPALPGGYAIMLGYAEFVRGFAEMRDVYLHDQHKIVSDLMQSDVIMSADRVHPTDHGYFVLARELLRAQGIDIGSEYPVPRYFGVWNSYVARLRRVLAGECMLIHDINMPLEDKLAMTEKIVREENWGRPVFEGFYRAYVQDKPFEEELYRLIDKHYESDIFEG